MIKLITLKKFSRGKLCVCRKTKILKYYGGIEMVDKFIGVVYFSHRIFFKFVIFLLQNLIVSLFIEKEVGIAYDIFRLYSFEISGLSIKAIE